MDTDTTTRLRSIHDYYQGGRIQPGNLAEAISRLPERPVVYKGEHFQIVDAEGNVRAQAGTPFQIRREAERLGVERYQRVATDGSRSVFAKDGQSWKLEPGLEAKVPKPVEVEIEVAPHDAKLAQRYVVGPARPESLDDPVGFTEYRLRGDESRVAFSSNGLSIWTENNSPSAIKSMVELAAGRKWDPIELSGHGDFVRAAWLEASLSGLRTRGYAPTKNDLDILEHERRERTIGPAPQPGSPQAERTAAARAIERRPEAQRAVLSAIEAVLVSRRVPEPRRQAVMHAATEKLAERARNGTIHRVKVYDRTATSHANRPATTPTVAPAREPVERVR